MRSDRIRLAYGSRLDTDGHPHSAMLLIFSRLKSRTILVGRTPSRKWKPHPLASLSVLHTVCNMFPRPRDSSDLKLSMVLPYRAAP